MPTSHNTATDDDRYVTHNLKEIIQILTDLSKQRDWINVSFNHGHDKFMTTVIAVDTKNHAVLLDIGRDESFNSKLLASHHVVFSKDEGIRIKWTSNNLSAVTLRDGRALKVPLPQSLVRVQRREFFRLTTPIIDPVPCRIPLLTSEGEDETVEFPLVDASLTGIAIMAGSELHPALLENASFDNCKITIPAIGTTNLTMQAKYIRSVSMKDGSTKHRIGLNYIEPSRGNKGLIEKFVFNLEREAMKVAS